MWTWCIHESKKTFPIFDVLFLQQPFKCEPPRPQSIAEFTPHNLCATCLGLKFGNSSAGTFGPRSSCPSISCCGDCMRRPCDGLLGVFLYHLFFLCCNHFVITVLPLIHQQVPHAKEDFQTLLSSFSFRWLELETHASKFYLKKSDPLKLASTGRLASNHVHAWCLVFFLLALTTRSFVNSLRLHFGILPVPRQRWKE